VTYLAAISEYYVRFGTLRGSK